MVLNIFLGECLKRIQELPRRKQAATQQQSQAVRETEENPFEDDEEEEVEPPPPIAVRVYPGYPIPQAQSSSSSSTPQSSFFGNATGDAKKSKKDKDKKKKKGKPFSLEAEKETMKNCIAESSVASTNLLNALRLINREREQISENKNAVHHFDFCKLLRRKILRYVGVHKLFLMENANYVRSNLSNRSSGSEPFFMQMTSL